MAALSFGAGVAAPTYRGASVWWCRSDGRLLRGASSLSGRGVARLPASNPSAVLSLLPESGILINIKAATSLTRHMPMVGGVQKTRHLASAIIIVQAQRVAAAPSCPKTRAELFTEQHRTPASPAGEDATANDKWRTHHHPPQPSAASTSTPTAAASLDDEEAPTRASSRRRTTSVGNPDGGRSDRHVCYMRTPPTATSRP